MNYTQARDYIVNHPEIHLQRDKSGKGWVCPLCGNGSGSDGTGLRLNPKNKTSPHYKCFRCGFYGDMIELIAQEQGLSGDSREAFELAREIYSITIDETERTQITESAQKKGGAETVQITEAMDCGAIKAYLTEARKASSEGEGYLQGRGISPSTAARFAIGYDTKRKAVVIPTTANNGNYGYTLRYTGSDATIRYSNAKGVSVGLFNRKALKGLTPVFIVEGAFDALSIAEVGYEALALNSGDNIPLFVESLTQAIECREDGSSPIRLIISFDNDDAGKRFTEVLSAQLGEFAPQSVLWSVANISGDYKDANERLVSDRDGLRAALLRLAEPESAQRIEANKVGSLLPQFLAYVQDTASNRIIPTGFTSFDKAIGGGLFPKLYTIGAISSLGKTTFVLQIADQIAQRGEDCIIFSLEMAKEDIIARSISRLTYEMDDSPTKANSTDELGILQLKSKAHLYSEEKRSLIKRGYKRYQEFASDHISIYEGRHTAAQIRQTVEEYIRVTGKKPLVIVDYLQILQPLEEVRRQTVREQVDASLDVLLAMRRQLKIPVIVVSSFNRSSYNTVADNTAFKESGAIEYSSDCIITLELDVERKKSSTGANTSNEAKENSLTAMRGEKGIRAIRLTFQKNRGNKVGSTIYYRYNCRYNCFEEDESKPAML